VSLDDPHVARDCAFWVWTLTGTGASCLVAESTSYYDAATHEHQLAHGIDA
jgi:hypothetical protein